MHLTLLCLIALAIAVPSLGHNVQAYKNGYYFGRSADIIVDDADIHPAEVQLDWQITKTHDHVQENVNSIQDVHIYNLVSRALGLPQIKLPKSYSMKSQMDDSVPFNPLSPLNGNVFFSIEGLKSASVPSTATTLGATPVYVLEQTARPYHPLSLLTTVVSGTQPRKHGIVNNRDLEVMTSNLFDISKVLYPEATIIAGSSCKCYSTVLSTHKDADSYYWDSETGSFARVSGEESTVVVNMENIQELLSFARQQVSFSATEAKIGTVAFDKEDVTLFAEAAFVSAASSVLGQSESQKFLSFHFKSLAKIATKYGAGSAQWTVAVDLIDAAITHALVNLKGCTSEIVYLPAYETSRVKELQSLIEPITAAHTEDNKFPQVYLTAAGQNEQEQLCKKTRDVISQSHPEVTVFCPLHGEEQKRAIHDDVPLVPLVADTPAILKFHYVLWTMLAIVAAILYAAYQLAFIPPDESLYTASTFYKGKGAKVVM
eukprot:TRINITY_DN10389_c0_g1_i1.p1 TRINITY_DN10389_c0_g1~~TRINITY_DN10389_c0_g1_i1.p1  ORF type:complete len:503 (-),score=143.37 TRINITY_DN10389_c0_g1_i1:69-1529(-)